MKKTIKTYDTNAHICNIECNVKVKAEKSVAIICFDNLGYGCITAVKFSAKGYDTFGNVIQINGNDDFFVIVQDIKVRKNSKATGLKAVLPDNSIRKLDLTEAQIRYEDGTVVSYNGENSKKIELEEYDEGAEKVTLCALKEKFGDDFRYKPITIEEGWICGCGTYNESGLDNCNYCGNSKTELFESTSSKGLKRIIDDYEIKEKQRIKEQEEKKRKNERINNKAKKITFIAVALLAAALLLFTLVKNVIIPNSKYRSAINLVDTGQYEEAIEAFETLGEYKDSKEQIKNCKYLIKKREYDDAVNLMNSGEYEEAIKAFTNLGDFEDSGNQIEECNRLIKKDKYDDAMSLMNNGEYDEAIKTFTGLGDFLDSQDKITQCQNKINEGKYNEAMAALNNKDYEKAITLFKDSKHYRDADSKIESCYKILLGEDDYNQIKGLNKGDTIYFGQYEQDTDIDNGPEDIEWYVLDKTDTKIFLLSKYAIEFKEVAGVDWKSSELREWLNNEFMDLSFSDEEKNKINNSVSNQDEDKVFLLSASEVDTYLARARFCEATAYADSLTNSSFYKSGEYRTWLLRSETKVNVNAGGFIDCVGKDGLIDYFPTSAPIYIRPAMWIELKD